MFSRRLNFPGKIIDKCIENLKSYRERFSADTALKICQYNPLPCSFSLQFIFFFQTDVLRRSLDIGFSYKHCNFTPTRQDGVENRDKAYSAEKSDEDPDQNFV